MPYSYRSPPRVIIPFSGQTAGIQRERTSRGIEAYPGRGLIRLDRPYEDYFNGRTRIVIGSPTPEGRLKSSCICDCAPQPQNMGALYPVIPPGHPPGGMYGHEEELGLIPLLGAVIVIAGALFTVGYAAASIIREIKGLKGEGNEERIQELVAQAQANYTAGKLSLEDLKAILAAARAGSADLIEDRGSTFMIPWIGKVPTWAIAVGAGLLGFIVIRAVIK